METEVIKVSPGNPEPKAVQSAAEALSEGELVGFPVETVYGLAGLCKSDKAMEKLRRLKQRPPSMPLPVQVAGYKEAVSLLSEVPLAARALMNRFWPGPLTIVFQKANMNLGGNGLGLRVPGHAVALAVLREVGAPLAVPSANPKGAPDPVNASEVLKYFPTQLRLLLDGGESQIKEPSTVVRIKDSGWELLREGLITRDMIAKLVSGKTYLFVCTGNTCRSPMAEVMARRMCAEDSGLSPEELRRLGFGFISAGIHAAEGQEASELAKQVAAEHGLSLHSHRSRPVSQELIREADRVLCMSPLELESVLGVAPEAKEKTALLADPAGIPDPKGGGVVEYRAAFSAIERGLKRIWG